MKDSEVVSAAKKYVKSLFAKADEKTLSFHNWNHSLNVFEAANLIANNTKGVSEDQNQILQLAALFHDVGYINFPKDHEIKSTIIAANFLNEKKYPQQKIKEVERIILATKLHHNPEDVLERIIIDADLSHLGSEDYMGTTYKLLFQEVFCGLSNPISAKDWSRISIDFFYKHQYLTEFAQTHFGKNKEKNLQKMKQLFK